VAALPFVDNMRSPPLTRALYLPRLSPARNQYVDYVLLRRRQEGLHQMPLHAQGRAQEQGQQVQQTAAAAA
jgi:hypothetical protein